MLNLRKKHEQGQDGASSAPKVATNAGDELDHFKSMLDCMPVNVMVADAQTLEITYLNKTSKDTLATLQHLLPVKVDDLVGTCIDVFHANPSHQRRMLADPSNLPHQTFIQLGEEQLDLLVSPMYDASGNYYAACVTWSIATEKLKIEAQTERLMNMLDDMPINVMTANPETLEIDYINKTSLDTLRPLQSLLPVPVDQLLGQCIDVFHKNPSHQRQLLADPANLPHQAIIELGEESLDLLVTAITDKDGSYLGPMLSWSVVTEKLKVEREGALLVSMINDMPINVMMCNPETLEITFINKTSVETLRPLQSLLPVPVDSLQGQCIDVFHKNPAHQRQLLGDPSNLPHAAKIELGEHTLDLRVAAVRDSEGAYIGPMVTWTVVTEQVKMIDDFENNVKTVIDQVSASAEEMRATSQSMSEMAAGASEKTTTVAAASEEATANVQTVAAAAEELSGSITEIGRQVAQSSEIAQEAVAEAQRTNDTVQGLSEASGKIGAVIDLINDIASQTNLLALNATIEAARAGEAGKGFAVVASEVKNLAGQTGNATEEIAGQIDAIQQATAGAVTAIEGIGETIGKINEIAGAIAAAVEEQGSATEEISRNVQEAATGTQQVTENITSVTQSTQETGHSASEVQDAAGELSKFAATLAEESERFLQEIKKL